MSTNIAEAQHLARGSQGALREDRHIFTMPPPRQPLPEELRVNPQADVQPARRRGHRRRADAIPSTAPTAPLPPVASFHHTQHQNAASTSNPSSSFTGRPFEPMPSRVNAFANPTQNMQQPSAPNLSSYPSFGAFTPWAAPTIPSMPQTQISDYLFPQTPLDARFPPFNHQFQESGFSLAANFQGYSSTPHQFSGTDFYQRTYDPGTVIGAAPTTAAEGEGDGDGDGDGDEGRPQHSGFIHMNTARRDTRRQTGLRSNIRRNRNCGT